MRSFFGRLALVDEAKLTRREKAIVQYIRNNLQTIVNSEMKIERLAQEVGTGYSAIYGLLKKLQIQGYRDFSISLASDAQSASIEIAANDEVVGLNFINLIYQNYAIIDKTHIYRTLQLIKKSQRIFIYAWENNLIGPAKELEIFLVRQKKDVYLSDSNWDMVSSRVEQTQPGDLYIFYSLYSNSDWMRKIIDCIKKHHGLVMLVSSRLPITDIAKQVDSLHTLITSSLDEEMNEDVRYVSRSVAFYYFDDLLIYHYLNAKKPDNELETLERNSKDENKD